MRKSCQELGVAVVVMGAMEPGKQDTFCRDSWSVTGMAAPGTQVRRASPGFAILSAAAPVALLTLSTRPVHE